MIHVKISHKMCKTVISHKADILHMPVILIFIVGDTFQYYSLVIILTD